jgi:hypothetical protein
MYAVVNHLHLSIPVDRIVDGVEREAIPLLKALPGFQGVNLVKVASDRVIVILYWDSAANADDGAKTFGPTWFAKNIAPYLASEQQRSVGELVVRYPQ